MWNFIVVVLAYRWGHITLNVRIRAALIWYTSLSDVKLDPSFELIDIRADDSFVALMVKLIIIDCLRRVRIAFNVVVFWLYHLLNDINLLCLCSVTLGYDNNTFLWDSSFSMVPNRLVERQVVVHACLDLIFVFLLVFISVWVRNAWLQIRLAFPLISLYDIWIAFLLGCLFKLWAVISLDFLYTSRVAFSLNDILDVWVAFSLIFDFFDDT